MEYHNQTCGTCTARIHLAHPDRLADCDIVVRNKGRKLSAFLSDKLDAGKFPPAVL
jgi:hypothetical protein